MSVESLERLRHNLKLHAGAGFVGGLRHPFCPRRNDRAAERLPAEFFDKPLPRHPPANQGTWRLRTMCRNLSLTSDLSLVAQL